MQFFTTDSCPSRTVKTNSGEMLYFSGTAYLCMPADSVFHQALQEGFTRYGSNFGGSRTANLRLSIYEETEDYLAQQTGAPAALLMSSGFMAGQLVAQWLREKKLQQTDNCRVFYAPETHPALWSGYETPTPFNTDNHAAESVYLCNAVDSIKAQIFDFQWLKDAAEQIKHLTAVVDDSHGFGITGAQGMGVWQRLPTHPQLTKIVVSSLGKAMGLPAGMVLGDKNTINQLRKHPFYSGASPASPAYLWAFLHIKDHYAAKLDKLKQNIRFFAENTKHLTLFSSTANYPVFYTANNQLYDYLLAQKILISSFPYPKADGELITRVVINACHTQNDLTTLIHNIKKVA